MKALMQFLVFLFLPCLLMAQFNSELIWNKLVFLEDATVKAELTYNGLDLFLQNNEINGDITLITDKDIELSAMNSVFLDAQDDIFLNTNGTNRVFVNELGNVGIGTFSPDQKLDVNGDIALTDGTGLIQWKEGSSFVKAHIDYNGNDLRIENMETDGRIYFNAQDQVRFNDNDLVLTNGRVGINTASPDATLDILAGTSTLPALRLFKFGDVYTRMLFSNSTLFDVGYWEFAGRAISTPSFEINFDDGNSKINVLTFLPNIENIEVNDDFVTTNTAADLGNNNSSEHWDDCVADDFINFSDRELKENIQAVSTVLPALLQLKPVHYQYLETFNPDGRLRTGFVAQEVLELFPNLVIDEDVDIDNAGNRQVHKSDYLSMNYIEFIPIAIKAIQEQQETIESLEEKVERLEKLVESLLDNGRS